MNHVDLSVLVRGDYPQLIASGLLTMLELTALTWLLAMILGTLLALARMTGNRLAQAAVATWVEYHQNVPTLIQLMMWYFAIPTLLPESVQMWVNDFNAEFLFSMCALGLCQAAYFSEDIRSGLRAIPDGQNEASRALGMSYVRSMRRGSCRRRSAMRCRRCLTTPCCCLKIPAWRW